MNTLITKTWLEDGVLHSQKIEANGIYKKEWVGLTDEDIAKNIYVEGKFMLPYSFASSIEAMLKEKNGY